MDPTTKNNVNLLGDGPSDVVFAHGFGCDQTMWRWVAPSLASDHRVVLFDHVGAGRSHRAAYDPERYRTLRGYALDAIELVEALGLRDTTWIGHSIGGLIGALAAAERPGLFRRMVMIAPSPRFLDDPPHYFGGFGERDIAELLDLMDHNFMGWTTSFASLVVPEPAEVAGILHASLCATDPHTARQFAEVTFRCDLRDVLPLVRCPTLVIQCTQDDIAPVSVGEYTAARLPQGVLRLVEARGHCPHMTSPEEVVQVIREFLRGPGADGRPPSSGAGPAAAP